MQNVLNQLRSGKESWRPSTVAVVDLQWGDTGKGKVIDLLSEWAEIVARGTGGANAGHTIATSGETYVFHLIPSGILWDKEGTINVIGSGVALDPKVLCAELGILRKAELSYDNLKISRNAHLVLPQHILLDRLEEAVRADGKIGTTGRGIAPVYADRVRRVGLTVLDLLNEEVFRAKLLANLKEKSEYLESFDPGLVAEILDHDLLEHGHYFHPEHVLNADAIAGQYLAYAEEFRNLVADTDALLRQSVGERRILLEGAQGVLLSVTRGIHPHVTSSDCSLAGLAEGVGLTIRDIWERYGIVKAPYMTRVGAGVFPTEFGGKRGAWWCEEHNSDFEVALDVSINETDPLYQGVAIRRAGHEYGATTGRPRRTGWLDLPLLRYALPFGGGRDLILTKVDVMDACEVIRVCNHYIYEGPDYNLGDRTLRAGDRLETAIPISEVLAHCTPNYTDFAGWLSPLGSVRDWRELPAQLNRIIEHIEQTVLTEKGTPSMVRMVSVGPDREQSVIIP